MRTANGGSNNWAGDSKKMDSKKHLAVGSKKSEKQKGKEECEGKKRVYKLERGSVFWSLLVS